MRTHTNSRQCYKKSTFVNTHLCVEKRQQTLDSQTLSLSHKHTQVITKGNVQPQLKRRGPFRGGKPSTFTHNKADHWLTKIYSQLLTVVYGTFTKDKPQVSDGNTKLFSVHGGFTLKVSPRQGSLCILKTLFELRKTLFELKWYKICAAIL